MSLPYHILKACGGIVFAARAGSIYSFNSDLEYISAWEYPVQQQQQTKGQEASATDKQKESSATDGPPPKRRKVESSQEAVPSNGSGDAEGAGASETKLKKKGKVYTTSTDRAFVQGLYSTTDGRHLVAITGSDKTIRVFEHDGAGNLKLLSERQMPKRPCDIAITPDNKTILSADKFGDVYGLPLIESEDKQWSKEISAAQQKSRGATPATSQAYKPQANEFTVHTVRNRKALENQKLVLEQRAKEEKAEGPQFEHTLLLGHVSMLTAIAVGTSPKNDKQYIITADRDEHIRISRSIPQTHVIEGYCLGHDEFISTICIPPLRPDLLISGGGDEELYVWNWVSNQCLSKTDLLKEAQKLDPEIVKLAVTRIFATRPKQNNNNGDDHTLVFVICERIPAVFCFQLKDSETTLQHLQTIPLPDGNNPLDVEYLHSSPSPRLLVAVDPNSSTTSSTENTAEPAASTTTPSIRVFSLEQGQWHPTEQVIKGPGSSPEEINPITVQELQKMLYTTESLRKTATDFD
ncbi:WD40-repeat-containing domain protein [Rhypophila sp. PSN 637]